MSASFEESVIALKSMFPDLSEVVVRATLEARDGHMESAVEKLLAMSRRGSGNGSSAHGGGRNGGQEYGGARFGAPGAVGMSPSATGGRNGQGFGNGGGGMGSNDFYSNVPPPREDEDSLWGWLTGDDDYLNSRGRTGQQDETWNWIANQMSYLALEVSTQIKGVTDAIAEEILGPPEEELGEEVEDITEEERERADVVSGGMAIQANRRTTQPKSEPKPKPKKSMRSSQEEYDDDEDDALGGILNLLGLEDDLDDDEQYVRRDSKKDK